MVLFNHSWEDKGVLIFPKGIRSKVNVIARLEFELAYYDSAVHRFNHYTTRTPPKEGLRLVTALRSMEIFMLGISLHEVIREMSEGCDHGVPKARSSAEPDLLQGSQTCGMMVGIRSVGVGDCQSEDHFVLARNPHKGLAREISYETGRRRGKTRSQSSQQIGVSDSQGKATVRERRLLKRGFGTCGSRSQVSQREKMSQRSW